ncbi:MAG: ABC transporter ATP-binding protein [Microthrixaceae bacterium]
MSAHTGRVGRALRIDSIRFSFPDGAAVLDDLSLAVDAGSVTSLLGPSGCGKTTLLRVVAGLDVAESGTVSIGTRELTGVGVDVPPEKRGVAMVFQDWALFPHMDVNANIAFGLPREQRRNPSVVAPTVELVGLEGLGSRMPEQLSGGQQQRVALARALAQQPDVLLLDEPFSNLDASLRARVRSDVRQLLGEIGVTTVMVTHDRDEAFVLGDVVALMRDGRIVQSGTPTEVYRDPVDEWSARFVGEVNVLDGVADGPHAETVLGRVPLSIERQGPVRVVARPEDLYVALSTGGSSETDSSATPASGVVVLVEYHGPRTHYLVDVDDTRIRVESAGWPVCEVGDIVGVGVAETALGSFTR